MWKATGREDPMKTSFDCIPCIIRQALDSMLQEWVENSNSPMEATVRLVIAGNMIDFGVNAQLTRIFHYLPN
jgi:uncharacterized protein with ATP-grasp and redox domains